MPTCTQCTLCDFCLPAGMRRADVARVETVVERRVSLQKGEPLYGLGDPVRAVYAVRAGMLKSTITTEDGRTQMVDYHLPGEVAGVDSLLRERHLSSATALEDSKVCVISVAALRTLADKWPGLRDQLLLLIAHEARHDRAMLTVLGLMDGRERLAAFLVELSAKLMARGFAPSEFILRMSREEIGAYLSLKLETVSRLFKALSDEGVIEVDYRHVRIRDMAALQQIYARASSYANALDSGAGRLATAAPASTVVPAWKPPLPALAR